MRSKYNHELGVQLIPSSDLDGLVSLAGAYTKKGSRNCKRLELHREEGYKFVAYAGPNVVEKGRVEHLPYHFHVMHKQDEELRILTEDFTEIDGLFVPKKLRMIFEVPRIQKFLSIQTKSVFETGKLEDIDF